MIKGPVFQEDITVLNVYSLKNRATKYVRQKLIKLQAETDESAFIAGDFTTPLSVTDKPCRQEISKDTVEQNRTINPLHLVDIYRLLHPTTADYTFFSNSHGIVTKIDYILGHKTHLNKCKGGNTTVMLSHYVTPNNRHY